MKNFRIFSIVLMVAMIGTMGCSKTPMGPDYSDQTPDDNTPPSPNNGGNGGNNGGGNNTFTPPPGWKTVYSGNDYYITAKDAGSHYEYEHWVRISSVPSNWQDCYLFGSADEWQVQPMSPADDWYRIRKSYSGLQKWNFCGGTNGQKWPGELMKHWAKSLYFWDSRAEATVEGYWGDLIAVFNGYNVRPATQADLDAWYESMGRTTGEATMTGVSITARNIGSLGKNTTNSLFFTTNAYLNENDERMVAHFPLETKIRVALGSGFYFAVSDGEFLYEFDIVVYMSDGSTKVFSPGYNANVMGSGTVCMINILPGGTIHQEDTYPIEPMLSFTYSVPGKSQDGNSRWNEKNKAFRISDDGSEWVNVDGNQRKIYFCRQMSDGSGPFFEIGMSKSDMNHKSSYITDGIYTYSLRQFPYREWFEENVLVRIEYDEYGTITNAGDIPPQVVFRVTQKVNWDHTIWSEQDQQGVTLRDEDDFYEFILTPAVDDTVWHWVAFAVDDAMRQVYVQYANYDENGYGEFSPKTHIRHFDKNTFGDQTSMLVWFGVTPDGEAVIRKGAYHYYNMVGGGQ